jgi:hypothetical protein
MLKSLAWHRPLPAYGRPVTPTFGKQQPNDKPRIVTAVPMAVAQAFQLLATPDQSLSLGQKLGTPGYAGAETAHSQVRKALLKMGYVTPGAVKDQLQWVGPDLLPTSFQLEKGIMVAKQAGTVEGMIRFVIEDLLHSRFWESRHRLPLPSVISAQLNVSHTPVDNALQCLQQGDKPLLVKDVTRKGLCIRSHGSRRTREPIWRQTDFKGQPFLPPPLLHYITPVATALEALTLEKIKMQR